MNQKKPLLDQSWVHQELNALRGEEPGADAIDRAVATMQVPVLERSARPRFVWRATALAAGIGMLALIMSLAAPKAEASDLKQIADAVRARKTRIQKTLALDAKGNLSLAMECWLEGQKQLNHFGLNSSERITTGFDGSRSFYHSSKNGGFIDDTESPPMPIEDVETYLRMTNSNVIKGVPIKEAGRVLDRYTVTFGGSPSATQFKFDLFVDPTTHLPARRDVINKQGELVERDFYEYPLDIPDAKFEVPLDLKLTDYPVMRNVLAKKLQEGGLSQTVGGVKVTLKAAIASDRHLMVLWTGGARGGAMKDSVIVEGVARPSFTGRPAPFSANYAGDEERKALVSNGQPICGDGAWFDKPVNWKSLKTVKVAIWEEDRSKRLSSADGTFIGFESKFVGYATFKIDEIIRVSDPERLLWRPSNGARSATTGN